MKLFIASLILFGGLGLSHAEESMTGKVQDTTNSVTRSAKKGMHRTAEAICGKLTGDNKVQCLAKEAKNRVEESKDAVADKVTEVKNKMDSEKK